MILFITGAMVEFKAQCELENVRWNEFDALDVETRAKGLC